MVLPMRDGRWHSAPADGYDRHSGVRHMFAVRTTCGPEIIEKRESEIIEVNRRVEMEI